MTHQTARPIPAKRIYMSRFTEDQWDMLQDGINEERNARAAARGCTNPECYSGGCPECFDLDESEGDEE